MIQGSGSAALRTPALWVAGVFFGCAAVLALDPLPFTSPVPTPVRVAPSVTDTTPVRRPKLKPEYSVAVFAYACSDCHRILPSPAETVRTLTQHREVKLDHGINTRCFNCHHPVNRDAFVDDFGKEIPWGQPQLLCAKCHGPVYRDWQHGSHGRTNGYWDTARGEQSRRRCIECHDPHQPPFPPMSPAPAPHTLRMGPRVFAGHVGDGNPLRFGDHSASSGAVQAAGKEH
jgi:hypothetical protein